ncbi:MAG: multidrug transporter [Herminiimonas sp.]|nr:multidrug transporter [Herminiimonas sp.]
MKLYRCAAGALLATLAAGCALQPVYQRPAAPVSASFPAGEAYKPPSGGAGGTTLPAADIGWRNFLPDPRLQRLVELALQNNRDLRVAVLNVEKVQAQYRIQRAALFPQVNVGVADASGKGTSGNASSSGNSSVNHNYSADLSASWEIDFFGRLRSLSDAAIEQYLASAHARQAAEILLVSQVADQYLTTLAYDEELAVTQKTLETAQASYKIVKLQFDTGTASELDLRLSQTTVEQALANHAAQLRLRAQAGNALVLLVGQPLPQDLPPAVRLGAQPILADIPAGLPSDLLARRPDILQAEAMLRSENADIGAARAAFFPRITLTGTLGTASSTLSGLFAAGSSAWSFVPSLIAPIFNAGANQANLDIAKVQKDIGVAQYEKAIQTAFREVSDGLAARGTYDDQLAALQRYTDAQQRRLELANMLYTNGIDSYLNVLTAQTDLYNAQIALVSARLNRLTSLVDLYRALGGGWIEHTGDPSRPADTAGSSAQSSARQGLQKAQPGMQRMDTGAISQAG